MKKANIFLNFPRLKILAMLIAFIALTSMAKAQDDMYGDYGVDTTVGFKVPPGTLKVKLPWTDKCQAEKAAAFKSCVSSPEAEAYVRTCAREIAASQLEETPGLVLTEEDKKQILAMCLQDVKSYCDEVAEQAHAECIERERKEHLKKDGRPIT